MRFCSLDVGHCSCLLPLFLCYLCFPIFVCIVLVSFFFCTKIEFCNQNSILINLCDSCLEVAVSLTGISVLIFLHSLSPVSISHLFSLVYSFLNTTYINMDSLSHCGSCTNTPCCRFWLNTFRCMEGTDLGLTKDSKSVCHEWALEPSTRRDGRIS